MKKLTYEYIKEQIESVEGYKLLSEEYIDAKTKLEVQCDKGHIYYPTYNYFQRSHRCPICAKNYKKHTYEYIKEQIEKDGYKLLSEDYVDAHTKLEVRCDKGHIYEVVYNSFQQGSRCLICSKKKNGSSQRLSYGYVKEQIEAEEGYELLSEEYVNSKIKLKIQCDKGHIYEANWGHFKSGQRCPHCAGKAKLTYEYVKEQIESVDGYKLISDIYINSKTNLKIQCNKDHIYKANWGHFRNGTRCPYCAGLTSKPEKELTKLVKKYIDIDFIENDRTQIYNTSTKRYMELDLYFPSLNKAVEFNGVYWHSIEEVKQRDIVKQKICKEKGIDLLVIEEKHWNNDKNECIEEIKRFLKEDLM